MMSAEMDPVTLSNITDMDMNSSLCDNNDTEEVFGPLEVYRYDDIYRE